VCLKVFNERGGASHVGPVHVDARVSSRAPAHGEVLDGRWNAAPFKRGFEKQALHVRPVVDGYLVNRKGNYPVGKPRCYPAAFGRGCTRDQIIQPTMTQKAHEMPAPTQTAKSWTGVHS